MLLDEEMKPARSSEIIAVFIAKLDHMVLVLLAAALNHFTKFKFLYVSDSRSK